MFAILTTLQQAIDYLQSCLTSANLQIVLLIGSGLLAIGLLLLALTRWGHSRPVWKCVILSVIAHILLIAFSWGTHLIAPTPVEVTIESEPMRINFEEDKGEDVVEVLPENDLEGAAAWDQFSGKGPLLDNVTLPRPEIDSDIVIEKSKLTPTKFPRDQSTAAKPDLAPATNETLVGTFKSTEQLVDQLAQTTRGAFETNQLVRSPEIQPHAIEVTRPGQFTPAGMPEPNFNPFTAEVNSTERADIVATDSGEFQLIPRSRGEFEKPSFEQLVPPPTATRTNESRMSKVVTNARLASSSKRLTPRNVSTDYATPRRLTDGQPLPSIYSLRNAPNRGEVAIQRGGSRETEEAVELALKWLAENQSKDGRWNPRLLEGGRDDKVYGHDREGAGTNADTGITSLAVLSFLANGYSHLEGPYQNNIKNGLEYLISHQGSDGNLAGHAKLFARMYCHSMSLLAISEAYAMTGDRRLAVAVQRGVNYSVGAQDPRDGGWRYQPGDEGDMSQFGWQVLALHSAELAGIDIPTSTQTKMVEFLNHCCISPSKGIAAYRPSHGPNTTMTAEALVCRHLLHQPINDALRKEATDRILDNLPGGGRPNMYYWYYGTMAMYLSGGQEWQTWNQRMKATLLDSQVVEGPNRGSWQPDGLWAGYGGRTYSTAMAALTLEVYYRYLPVLEVANRESGETFR